MIRADLYASFPWYDLPEMRSATDAFWERLRERLNARGIADIPSTLDRVRPHGTDRDGAALFTQTCGYPLFTTARGHFTILGAPRYRVPGCEGSLHRSFIVVRATETIRDLAGLRGKRFAINEVDSNSGMNLPRRLFAPLARGAHFFSSTVVTGSHAASAALVASGGADAAAIDCVTHALLKRYRPSAVRNLRIIAETLSSPTPPLVTSIYSSMALVAELRGALLELTSSHADAPICEALFLAGMDICDVTAYDVIVTYEREAERLDYALLA